MTVIVGPHHLFADEPAAVGGADTGPGPYDYVLAGLGACTSITMRMYADRKSLPLDRVTVTLSHSKIHAEDCAECETKVGMLDQFDRVIAMEGALDAEQRKRLMEIADKCPVHRTLELGDSHRDHARRIDAQSRGRIIRLRSSRNRPCRSWHASIPKRSFQPEEWSRLTSRSSLRGLWLVAHAWGTIAAAIALVALWPNPLTWLIAVMVVGTRQIGLAILMHEAAHGGLHGNKAVNEWIGQWLCAVPVGADLASYRSYHLQHHKFTQQPEDPDLSLSAPFPISKESYTAQGDPRSHRADICQAAAAAVAVAVPARGRRRRGVARKFCFQRPRQDRCVS